MKLVLVVSSLLIGFWASAVVATPSGSAISYEGTIIKPDGTPETDPSVTFDIKVRSPDSNNCLLYEETRVLNMSGSNGDFSFTLNDGSGTRTDSSGYTFDKIFANRGAFNVSGGCTYTPGADDGRVLVVSFTDSLGVAQQIPQEKINFVPFAIEAKQIAGFTAGSLLRVVDGSNNPLTGLSALSNAEYTALLAVADGTAGYVTSAQLSSIPSSTIAPATGGLSLAPVSGASVTVPSSTASTSPTTGAFVVTGGIGVGGGINASGSISTNGAISASSSTFATTDIASGKITASGAMIFDNLSGRYSLFIGSNAGSSTLSSSGSYNTAIGVNSLMGNTTSSNNTALGAYAVQGATGSDNTGVGYRALASSSSVMYSTAVGSSAFSNVSNGVFDVAIGFGAGNSLTSSSNANTIVGAKSPATATSIGDGNVVLGAYAGDAAAGTSIVIGAGVAGLPGQSSSLDIGNLIYGIGLGTSSSGSVSSTPTSGSIGIGTSAPTATLDVAGSFKAGTAGIPIHGMGACQITTAVAPTTSGATASCLNAPISGVAITCTPATPPSSGSWSTSLTGIGGQVKLFASAAGASATTWACMWIAP